ncbi:uncharacterized protein LOC118410013 [Branchiostoma floridae]|uniref:Uncharacterized protein LOC118410013 n=1 Tax=Branchiostoma floridae TaxID=7739 RepID=A0A9J7MH33_BRAFL|nr:uncharacterized protein LOC118410013 [Branchiostoma floridae]
MGTVGATASLSATAISLLFLALVAAQDVGPPPGDLGPPPIGPPPVAEATTPPPLLYVPTPPTCHPNDTCSDRCGTWSPGTMCQCDPKCRLFDDCCKDVDTFCGGAGATDDIETASRPVVMADSCTWRCGANILSGAAETFCDCTESCVGNGSCCSDHCSASDGDPPSDTARAVPNDTAPYECLWNGGTDSYVWMVASCPETWTDSVTRKGCLRADVDYTDVSDVIFYNPVSDVTSDVAYRNVYCAVCNGGHNVTFWTLGISGNLELVGSEEAKLNATIAAIQSGQGRAYFRPPVKTRECVPRKTNYQSDQGGNCFAELCAGHAAYVSGDTGIYRNVYCAQCEGVHSQELEVLSCGMTSCRSCGGASQLHLLSLTILFNFNPLNTDSSSKCPPGSTYDLLSRQCRQIIAEPTQAPPGEICVDGQTQVVSGGGISAVGISIDSEPCQEFISPNLTVDNCTDCDNPTPETHPTTEAHHAEDNVTGILNIALTALSAVGGIVYLALCVVTREYHSIPGRLKMQLVITLTAAQSVFLGRVVAQVSTAFCYFVAVLGHYLFLAAFLTMSALAFDLHNTFSRGISESRFNSYRLYILYTWLLPAVVVGVTAFVDFCPCITTVSVGYGGQACWIGEPYALLAVFGGPVALVLITNAIFMVLTVVALQKATKAVSKIRRDKSRSLLWVYVRITVLLGFTWGLGFAVSFVRSLVLDYIFTVLSAAQAFLVALAFVLNRSMLRRCEAAFRRNNSKSKNTHATQLGGGSRVSRRESPWRVTSGSANSGFTSSTSTSDCHPNPWPMSSDSEQTIFGGASEMAVFKSHEKNFM